MALVEYDVKDKIAFITFNRPEKLNAINKEMFNELVSVCQRYNEDRDALVAILYGKGRAFCSGADLAGEDPEFIAKVDTLYLNILTLTKPTIAAVHGFCLAQGIGITLCSDIRVAAEDTKFGCFNLINRVVPGDKLMSTAEEIAKKIAANAPLAVQAMKEAALMGLEVNLAQRLRIGGMIIARVMQTKDAQEGLRAFEEKREPVWRGE